MTRTAAAARRLMDLYPRIYFACHARHRRDPGSERVLSAHQASVLDHLDPAEPTGLTKLAEHMGVTPSTMSLNVDRLERLGYLERRRSGADRRRVELVLTAAGERVKRAQSVLEPERVEALLRGLTPRQRRAALDGLELLAGAAEQAMRERSRQGSWWSRGA